jgi:hypothetical protein
MTMNLRQTENVITCPAAYLAGWAEPARSGRAVWPESQTSFSTQSNVDSFLPFMCFVAFVSFTHLYTVCNSTYLLLKGRSVSVFVCVTAGWPCRSARWHRNPDCSAVSILLLRKVKLNSYLCNLCIPSRLALASSYNISIIFDNFQNSVWSLIQPSHTQAWRRHLCRSMLPKGESKELNKIKFSTNIAVTDG